MAWWGWIVIGALLLIAEIAFIDLEFYLVFIGVSALAVGLLALFGIALPVWAQWMLFAALSLGSMVLFRQRIYRKLRPAAKGFDATPGGETFRLAERLGPGETCRADFRGTTWTVKNGSEESIEAGELARIERADSLVLLVKKVD
jgi:membrane protein implicated in regulation of membrane protease activity